MHLTFKITTLDGSVGQAHLLNLLLQLVLMLHLVFGTCVIFLGILYVLYVLDICIQIVDLNLEIYVNGGACLVWCLAEVFALLAFHVVVGWSAMVAFTAFVLWFALAFWSFGFVGGIVVQFVENDHLLLDLLELSAAAFNNRLWPLAVIHRVGLGGDGHALHIWSQRQIHALSSDILVICLLQRRSLPTAALVQELLSLDSLRLVLSRSRATWVYIGCVASTWQAACSFEATLRFPLCWVALRHRCNIQDLRDLQQLSSFVDLDLLFPLLSLHRRRVCWTINQRILEHIEIEILLLVGAQVVILIQRLTLVLNLAVKINLRHLLEQKMLLILLHRLVTNSQIHFLHVGSLNKTLGIGNRYTRCLVIILLRAFLLYLLQTLLQMIQFRNRWVTTWNLLLFRGAWELLWVIALKDLLELLLVRLVLALVL